jgi:imidazole glycerol-phosphate synthase
VHAAEAYLVSGKSGQSSIEQISRVYGNQAVVVSIDPKRVYVDSKDSTPSKHVVVELDSDQLGPNGERCCWYQCTVKGGREARDICAVTVAKASESLGAGEIMTIPVIASSGAGQPEHFTNVFSKTNVQAALAAGMFHRKEVEIEAVKEHMRSCGVPARKSASTLS